MYGVPASAVAARRNHKVEKRVWRSRRGHLGDGKVQNQATISHNSNQLRRDSNGKPNLFKLFMDNKHYKVGDENSVNVVTEGEGGTDVDGKDSNKVHIGEHDSVIQLAPVIVAGGGPLEILDDSLFQYSWKEPKKLFGFKNRFKRY